MSDKAPKDSEQYAAEADVEAFEHDLGPFVIAAKSTRMPMVFTDARESDHPIIFANDSFLKLTGYDRDEVMAQSFDFLLAAGTDTGRRRSKRALRGTATILSKSARDERTAVHSGRHCSSMRSVTKQARWCSISYRS